MEGVDRSAHPTVVEYAVRNMMKGQSPSVAAKNTVKKLSGYENMFLGPGVALIDAEKLETELWVRMVEFTLKIISRYPDKTDEVISIGMTNTLVHFEQATWSKPAKPGVTRNLKTYILDALAKGVAR